MDQNIEEEKNARWSSIRQILREERLYAHTHTYRVLFTERNVIHILLTVYGFKKKILNVCFIFFYKYIFDKTVVFKN